LCGGIWRTGGQPALAWAAKNLRKEKGVSSVSFENPTGKRKNRLLSGYGERALAKRERGQRPTEKKKKEGKKLSVREVKGLTLNVRG